MASITACSQCRGRKVKCGKQQPTCANCRKKGLPCDFSNKSKRVNTQKQLAHDVSKISESLDRIADNVSIISDTMWNISGWLNHIEEAVSRLPLQLGSVSHKFDPISPRSLPGRHSADSMSNGVQSLDDTLTQLGAAGSALALEQAGEELDPWSSAGSSNTASWLRAQPVDRTDVGVMDGLASLSTSAEFEAPVFIAHASSLPTNMLSTPAPSMIGPAHQAVRSASFQMTAAEEAAITSMQMAQTLQYAGSTQAKERTRLTMPYPLPDISTGDVLGLDMGQGGISDESYSINHGR